MKSGWRWDSCGSVEVFQQHSGSEPLKALKLKLASVKTHSYNSVCVFSYCFFSSSFHGLNTEPLWEYNGRCRPVKGIFLKSEGRKETDINWKSCLTGR